MTDTLISAERAAVGLPEFIEPWLFIDPRLALLQTITPADFEQAMRFLAKTTFRDLTGCLVWIGAASGKGADGMFHIDGRTTTALRASYRLFCSPVLPPTVRRTCLTRGCVHPDHIGPDPRRIEPRKAKVRGTPIN